MEVQCPVCCRSFPVNAIEYHAENCFQYSFGSSYKRKFSYDSGPPLQQQPAPYKQQQQPPQYKRNRWTNSNSRSEPSYHRPYQPPARARQRSPFRLSRDVLPFSVSPKRDTYSGGRSSVEPVASMVPSGDNKKAVDEKPVKADASTKHTPSVSKPVKQPATKQAKTAIRRPGVPLAELVRPKILEELIGHREALGPGTPLYLALTKCNFPNLLLWGPPGCGKTSIGRIIQKLCMNSNNVWRYAKLSACTSSVKELRDRMEEARNAFNLTKTKTLLFMDEIHHFNKTQQDIFLPFVESGLITLVGSTTENPSFSLNTALISRCQVIVLEPLTTSDVYCILTRAVKSAKVMVLEEDETLQEEDKEFLENFGRSIGVDNVEANGDCRSETELDFEDDIEEVIPVSNATDGNQDMIMEIPASETYEGVSITHPAVKWLAGMSGGDARVALNTLQTLVRNVAAAVCPPSKVSKVPRVAPEIIEAHSTTHIINQIASRSLRRDIVSKNEATQGKADIKRKISDTDVKVVDECKNQGTRGKDAKKQGVDSSNSESAEKTVSEENELKESTKNDSSVASDDENDAEVTLIDEVLVDTAEDFNDAVIKGKTPDLARISDKEHSDMETNVEDKSANAEQEEDDAKQSGTEDNPIDVIDLLADEEIETLDCDDKDERDVDDEGDKQIENVNKDVIITVKDVRMLLQRSHVAYDRAGEGHYSFASALQKSVRGGDDNAALYWLLRMLQGGESPVFVARRLLVSAAEDIGLGDPQAVSVVVSCMQAVQLLGPAESAIVLANCAVYLARAKHNPEVYQAMSAVKQQMSSQVGSLPSVPLHLRNASTPLMKKLGYGKGYSTNPDEMQASGLSFLPENLKGVNFFKK